MSESKQIPAATNPTYRLGRDVYPSAVDRWLVILLVLPIAISAGLGLYFFWDGRPGDASVMFLTAAAILAVTGMFTVPCRYTLLDDALSIRCGVICYQVAYADIHEIKPSSTLLSGPALSLRRVIVSTKRRNHILSPVDREHFIEQLQRRLPATSDHETLQSEPAL